MPVTSIHKNIKRCMLSDAGVRNFYLDPNNSALKEGSSWQDSQGAASGTSGMVIKGTFPNAAVGKMVHNATKDFLAKITAVGSGEITVHPNMSTAGTNYGVTDGTTTANKLIDSGATFTTDVSVGQIVALRDLSDYAVITAIDSDTTLSLSKDIFPTGTKYTIMEGFEVGDTVRLGTVNFDGSDGQVMVEIPKFYWKRLYSDPSHSWGISPAPATGYSLFPAFMVGGVEKDYIYIGAFEGVIDDIQFDSPVLTGKNLGTDKLASLPFLTPLTNGQRSEFRTVAENRGAGWHQQDWWNHFALQILWMVENETVNSQTVHTGITNWSVGQRDALTNSSANSALGQTGYSLANGNSTIDNSTGGDAGSIYSYRGVENFYGHLWKFTDGININDWRPYVADNPANFADDITTNYNDTGVDLPQTSDYISALHNSDYGLLPSAVAAAGNTFLGDYYYQASGWRVILSGGDSDVGDLAGFATLFAHSSSSRRDATIASRVCFK